MVTESPAGAPEGAWPQRGGEGKGKVGEGQPDFCSMKHGPGSFGATDRRGQSA